MDSQERSMESPGRSIVCLDQVVDQQKKDTSILLDKEERDLVKRGDDVTKEEMWKLLESKRFSKLKESAVNLQGDLIYNQRCPICTLMPPCKHYQSNDQILGDAGKFLQSSSFKQHMSPRKLQGLMHAMKDHPTPGLLDYLAESPKRSIMINDTSVAQFDTGSRNNRGAATDMSMGHRRNTSLPGIGMSKSLLS